MKERKKKRKKDKQKERKRCFVKENKPKGALELLHITL